MTKPGTSNEALDCLVYAYAAICLCKAKSRRVRDAAAIKLEWRLSGNPAPGTAASALALNGPRPGADPAQDGEHAPAGVRRISGDRRAEQASPPAVAEAAPAGRRRYGVVHRGLGR